MVAAPVDVFRVRMLGPFSISVGEQVAGPWARPSAKRLCELVMLSPGRRVTKQQAREALFPSHDGASAANQLNQALSRARSALSGLGPSGARLLCADRASIWADPHVALSVDLELLEDRLTAAMKAEPGLGRDGQLVGALMEGATLLEDEPFAEWVSRPRERLEWARQEARLTLARDRSKGMGRSAPGAVVQAWQACLDRDASCEEAAASLVRIYTAQRQLLAAEATYARCRENLEALGLRVSPALEEAHALLTARTPFSGAPAGLGAQADRARAGHREERRLVSVLFAELTGPIGTGARLGPEELRELVGGVLAEVVDQVEWLGGTVTSVSGSGLVALFGAPEAHEDDPERALRAAFGAVATSRHDRFSLRAAVETGEAVVGPLVGGRDSHYGAMGEVVGLAAALQSVARPASVLVGPATRLATEGIFEWGLTESVTMAPGQKAVVATYLERLKARPVGEAGRRSLARNAPLVGRRAEVAALRDVLRAAISGNGSVTLVSGDPGLGKTRLVSECRRLFLAWAAAGSGHLPLWLEGRAASYASTSPYGLYRQLLTSWVGVPAEAAEENLSQALERATSAIFSGSASEQETELLGRLVGLSPRRDLRLTPEQLQQATFAAFRSLVSRLASHGPTVIVLEDLHWADPTSLHLTAQVASLVRSGPLLVLLTRRPEPDPGVSALEAALEEALGPRFQSMELVPLEADAARDLARSLLSEGAPEDAVDMVSDGADGNPLFVEERLSTLLETGALSRDATGWHVDRGLSGGIPEVLERLVRARIDRLPRGPREALVAASVLGPEFGLSALRAVTGLDGDLDQAVAALRSGGLLVELAGPSEPVYRFRHALIEEATYKGLVRAERRRLHALAAWGIESSVGERAEDSASVLGRHFALAGEAERAAHYLEVAADRAAATFANEEAVASYKWALEVLDELSSSPERGPHELQTAGILLKLGDVEHRLGRFEEAKATIERAALLSSDCDVLLAARCYCHLGLVEGSRRHHEEALLALEKAETLLAGAENRASDDWVSVWIDVENELLQLFYWWQRPEPARPVLERARPVVEARGTSRQKARFYNVVALQRFLANQLVVDESILADFRAERAAVIEGGLQNERHDTWFDLGFALLWYGDLDEAWAELEESLRLARRVGDRTVELRVITYLAVAALRLGDVARVKELAPEVEQLAQSLHFGEYAGQAKALMGWVAWKEGRARDAEDLAREALLLWETSALYPMKWPCLLTLVALRMDGGRLAEAVEAARGLVAPRAQRLPKLEPAIILAIEAWERDDAGAAKDALGDLLRLAREFNYA